jgi:hypothetical protein
MFAARLAKGECPSGATGLARRRLISFGFRAETMRPFLGDWRKAF